ncbi:Hypothetical Protein sle_24110 [Streptomyces leeuwenhoekii]|uniref:Uncharacterized protein n=1 Tax=Streptomyces leeuwenhoekii TaxID=1437453 RepID=A0A0F7VWI7_STRLW|nr:Hypothetical Protein sle_24110 [Streptomyces leeuwenhoekii]
MVVADHVLVEDGDVTARGLDAEVAQQGGADVDGQAAVDQLGGEDPPEVVRGELQAAESGVVLGQVLAASADHVLDGAGVEDLRSDRSVLALEEEGHRSAPDLVVRVVATDQGDRLSPPAVASDDRGDHVEQFGRHRDDALAVGLGRRDDQQGDDFAVRALILADAEVGELAHLLDADAGVPQGLHRRPVPERGLFVCLDVHQFAGVQVQHAGGYGVAVPEKLAIRLADHPAVGGPSVAELLAVGGLVGAFEQEPALVVAGLDVLDQDGQEGLALPGAVRGAFGALPPADAQAVEFTGRDGTRCDPGRPTFGFVSSPGVQVVIEAPDGDDDVVLAHPVGAVVLEPDRLAPACVEVRCDPKALLIGVELFDLHPEVLDQQERELLQAGVVEIGATPTEVVDQQTPDGLVADTVLVDELLDGPLASHHRRPHGRRRGGREPAHGDEGRPHSVPEQAVGGRLTGLETAAGQPVVVRVLKDRRWRDVGQRDALIGEEGAHVEHGLPLVLEPQVLCGDVLLEGDQ